jgi:hypothetical protein
VFKIKISFQHSDFVAVSSCSLCVDATESFQFLLSCIARELA